MSYLQTLQSVAQMHTMGYTPMVYTCIMCENICTMVPVSTHKICWLERASANLGLYMYCTPMVSMMDIRLWYTLTSMIYGWVSSYLSIYHRVYVDYIRFSHIIHICTIVYQCIYQLSLWCIFGYFFTLVLKLELTWEY